MEYTYIYMFHLTLYLQGQCISCVITNWRIQEKVHCSAYVQQLFAVVTDCWTENNNHEQSEYKKNI
jgi:hypothetical protein